MNISIIDVRRAAWGAALGAMLVGCASAPPAPRPEVSQAERAVNEAVSTNSSEFAALEVRKAREKLSAAQAAMQDERYDDARRLADEALVDAELARAKAEASRAETSAQELAQTIERLREEAIRSGETQRVQ